MRGKTHGQALASFGGITRIRFKGSSTNRDLSAIRLPRTTRYAKVKIRKVKVENKEQGAGSWKLGAACHQRKTSCALLYIRGESTTGK